MSAIAVRERVALVAPFAVRFQDVATGALVRDGLSVELWFPDAPEERTAAFANASGLFVIPRLRAFGGSRFGAGDDGYWTALAAAVPPVERQAVVEVVDRLGRFAAIRFTATLPRRRVYGLDESAAPDDNPPPIPLFSAPSRPVPGGMAVVRAQVGDALNARPAAGALLDISIAGVVATGLAARDGQVAALIPWPAPPGPPAPLMALSAQTWPVEVRVRYRPPLPLPPSDDPRLNLVDWRVAAAQPAATWAAPIGAPAFTATLAYGRELILRGAGGAATIPVTPA